MSEGDLKKMVGALDNGIKKHDTVKTKGENCDVCDTFVEGFEYKMCCSAFDCGCMGQPVEPCICSNECWDTLMSKKGK